MSKPIYYLLTTEFARIVQHLLTIFVEKDDITNVKKKLFVESLMIRPYLLTPDIAVKRWEAFRSLGDSYVDIILNGTVHLDFLLQANDSSLSKFGEALATSYGKALKDGIAEPVKSTDKKDAATEDSALGDRFSTEQELKDLFTKNPWILFLLAMSFIKEEDVKSGGKGVG